MIEILRYPTAEDWQRCKAFALNTVGKKFSGDVTEEWKQRILRAEHSPIRTLMFTIRMEVPYYVSVHFCRHKFGVEHYVTSQRNDRQDKYDRDAARQDETVTHIMDINAAELIAMSHKRMCGNADQKTQEVMYEICEKVAELCPEFQGLLSPTCMYLKRCPEMVSCGFYENME